MIFAICELKRNLATSHKNKYEFGIWSPIDVTKWVQSCSVSKETFDLTVTIGTDALV